jgi:hypothetical protein
MSSSSTNKSPLLIDRPLHVVARLDQTSQPAGSLDPGTGTNGVLLLDCTGSSDGAFIDTIYLIQRVSDDESIVNLFFSESSGILGVTTTGGQANAWFINTCKFPPTSSAGSFVEFSLPFVLSPVPHAGTMEAVPMSGTVGVQAPPRFRGLYVPRGKALWAAVFAPAPIPEAPNIALQGGWY